jgi:hypothetical protein
MPLSLFAYNPKQHFIDAIGEASEFGHTFGGDPEGFGIRFVNSDFPLHLIYRLNLDDPLVPIDIPNVKWLPLLYGFRHTTARVEHCYRVRNDSEIELVAPQNEEVYKIWDAPATFPHAPTRFRLEPYDPTVAEDAIRLKGIFGWDDLSRRELDRALELIQASGCSYSLDDAPDDDWTYEDVIRCMYDPPFVQGKSFYRCRNPVCNSENFRVIALQDAVIDRECIWYDNDFRTFWIQCLSCDCINVSHQCT